MSKQSELVALSRTTRLDEVDSAYGSNGLSNRNLIINGAMQVAQRGTSETGVTASGYYTVDRYMHAISSLGTHTITQEDDGPAGVPNSLKVEVTVANASPSSGAYLTIEHKLEGQNLQHLKKGTADAQPVTLSFWVKSNVTGTYILELDDIDNNRKISKAYTVITSGVWEHKTITIAGDTTGSFDNDASASARLIWWLDAGSNFRSGTLGTAWRTGVTENRVVGNVAFGGTVGNTFQITGVQLEVGEAATPFEHRSYGDELAKCQRYCWRITQGDYGAQPVVGIGNYNGNTQVIVQTLSPVTMRAVPTLSYSNLSHFDIEPWDKSVTSLSSSGWGNGRNFQLVAIPSSGDSKGDAATLIIDTSGGWCQLDAEL